MEHIERVLDPNCLFCKIIMGEIPGETVYESDDVLGFADINPMAPIHVLFVPKQHLRSVSDIEASDKDWLTEIFEAAANYASEQGIAQDGFRIVANVGQNGGQAVDHLHFHLLGGRQMQWPPG